MADTLVDQHALDARPSVGAYRSFWFLIGAGWLLTNAGYSVTDLPFTFLLKDKLHMDEKGVAFFFFISQFTNYIKPVAGILTDAIPLFGTRRRYYLLISLLVCGSMFGVLTIVPQRYFPLLLAYTVTHIFIVLISTTLGGVMVEGGARFHATGRLSAQRVGVFRVVEAFGGPVSGWFLKRNWYYPPFWICTVFHFLLIPLFARKLKEEPLPADYADPGARLRRNIQSVKAQWRVLISSKTLWAAAGLVFLVIAAPGFGTPLLFYQTDTLHFSKQFIGNLKTVTAIGGFVGAGLFAMVCGRVPLRPLVAAGITSHVIGAMLFLWYRTETSAVVITGLYWCAQTLALLPLYDLAMRATPRGSEALGYSVMMSVWNLTDKLSNLVGSILVPKLGFTGLIYLNAGTTAAVLFFVPMLPSVLTNRRDGQPVEAAHA